MNVIIANKMKPVLDSLDIEVIKRLDGEFTVDEIISQFHNFYYQRLILDVTALKNYKDIKVLQKLSITLDMDKLILLLDGSEETSSPMFLSKLISIGIYNFTQNIDGLLYLYNNPNTYRDVADLHQIDMTSTVQQGASGFGMIGTSTEYGFQSPIRRIIGIKNITKSSGATTLIYSMKKQLEKNYKVVAIEVDKNDFWFMRSNYNKAEENMVTTNNAEVGNVITRHSDANVILVDVNNSVNAESFCQEMVYLIEPSIIKLNSILMIDPKTLIRYKDKKVVLNQSLLSAKDVSDFEFESNLRVFYNMPPIDERQKNQDAVNVFLVKLGFTMQQTEEMTKKRKALGIF